jgi:hypothetical protein
MTILVLSETVRFFWTSCTDLSDQLTAMLDYHWDRAESESCIDMKFNGRPATALL